MPACSAQACQRPPASTASCAQLISQAHVGGVLVCGCVGVRGWCAQMCGGVTVGYSPAPSSRSGSMGQDWWLSTYHWTLSPMLTNCEGGVRGRAWEWGTGVCTTEGLLVWAGVWEVVEMWESYLSTRLSPSHQPTRSWTGVCVCVCVGGRGVCYYVQWPQAGEDCLECERGCERPRPPGCSHVCSSACHPGEAHDLCVLVAMVMTAGECPQCTTLVRVECHCLTLTLFVKC